MTGIYKIAGRRIGIESLYEEVHGFCRDYRAEGIPDFTVTITQADVARERTQATGDYPDSSLEILAVYRKIADHMLGYDTLLIHGSCVAVYGAAYLFAAKSGTVSGGYSKSQGLFTFDLTMGKDVSILTPAGGRFDKGQWAVVDASGNIATEVEIREHIHTFDDDGICTVCGTLDAVLMGSNLVLEGRIGINFYIRMHEAIAANPDTVLKFIFDDGDSQTIPVSEARIDTTSKPGTTLYVFSCDVAAKEMTDSITVQVVMGDRAGKAYTHSVQRYATMLLNSTSSAYTEACRALVKAMINYGGYTQFLFKYNHDAKPANQILTDEEVAAVTQVENTVFEPYKAVEVTKNANIGTYAGSSLILEAETTLMAYFKLAEGVDAGSLTFTVDGEEVTAQQNGEYYMIYIRNIAAQDLEKVFTVTVSNGSDSMAYAVSVFSYCYDVMQQAEKYGDELVNTLKAMYLYNAAANTYFDR